MKTQVDRMNQPWSQIPRYSGSSSELAFDKEFDENEENDENNFYSLSVDDYNNPTERKLD